MSVLVQNKYDFPKQNKTMRKKRNKNKENPI